MSIDWSAVSCWSIVAAIVLAAASGLYGLTRPRTGPAGERLATWMIALGCAAAIASAVLALLGNTGELDAAWSVPGGRLRLGVDAVSAMFVLPIALVCALGAIYGRGYWPQHEHPRDGRKLRAFYGVLTGGLLLVVVARNAILFLLGWEVMALAAYLLITTEDEDDDVRDAGYVYLLATRVGTLCLFAMFALLATSTGSLDFGAWQPAFTGPMRDAIFITAMIGFGLKAGLVPLHIWLPGAHARAPSHVSAQMSGVLIKVGIYGIVRITGMCSDPPMWWGVVLIVAGTISAVLGVGFAIAQHDLKRLLAYHSVENIGIITLGLGVALLGRSLGREDLVVLGLAGALLHVWNHALFKSLLFFSAGAIAHAAGTREIDKLGGLWRRMPRTGLAFLVGAIAICALPPLNGLVSELFIFLGLFRATIATTGSVWLLAMMAAALLALVGALALACFVKAFGATFLGVPRSSLADVHDPDRAMIAPMVVLGGACIAIGIGVPLVAPILDVAIDAWHGGELPALAELAPTMMLAVMSGAVAIVLAMFLVRAARPVPQQVPTWDCGYAAPSARMQYTSSSFAELIVRLLSWALRPQRDAPVLVDPFPKPAHFETHVPDTVLDRGIRPVFELIGRAASRLRPFQSGSTHFYLLYILATLVVLLLWGRT